MEPPSMLYSQLKATELVFLLAGPNVIESEEYIMKLAKHIKTITSVGIPLVFKSSFVKANRTSSKSFGGLGMVEVLKILEKVKVAYDLPIVIDVHDSIQVRLVGRIVDIIQITAFLCRQTDLLVVAAKTGKIVHIKKGQFCAPSMGILSCYVMANSAEKVRLAGNPNVMVCERGTMFGYNDFIVDPRNLEWMREANCPIVSQYLFYYMFLFKMNYLNLSMLSYSMEGYNMLGRKLDGGGVASGGLRELIPCIVRAAVAIGVDGIFMEVHDDPLSAPVDGST
ncbi:2-dehydro-3-deoxyphosphooctonate aldolase-like [Arachis ipaensis]|uniref:2-dehydro-3-deoxyphosphooctonate aldolase-like n=1 Tax=Arachis ipaensis TaxID=130454 RepID=UPI000A2B32D2|nr:2-dehydro-3-deoxyphosphooctonate aldolase-like [Arachis ipaensis]